MGCCSGKQIPLIIFEKSVKGPVLYIRHSTTEYNDLCLKSNDNSLKSNSQYLDCPLNQSGISLAEDLGKKLSELKIKYVFSSPMKRCLETTYHSLKNHKEKNSFVVIVHPDLTEFVGGVQDYSRDIKAKQTLYNLKSDVKFDWSLFNSIFKSEREQENYFLEFVDNYDPNTQPEIKKIVDEIAKTSNNEAIINLIKIFLNLNKKPESFNSLFKRTVRFKKHLSDLMSENGFDVKNKNEEKILVFTHSNYERMATSRKAYDINNLQNFPEDCYKPNNCEIMTMNI
jgi:broad specificity phosphatase PhoE